MAFEKYEGQRPRGNKNIVSVRKNGQIAFNSKAVQSFEVNKYQYAYLFFDKDKDIIGIELSNKKEKGARKITRLGGTAIISGNAFLKHFEIIMEKARKCEPYQDISTNMIMLSL